MSHFGKAGPPDIRDTYSLLVLNISFRTTADDLYPLFDKYGKVVDVFIPRDRRTGDSRGFAFVRYKYADEAHKAVERLDGRTVDGREIMVQFAKYGPNAERIQKGRIIESASKERSRSRSPRPRHREDYRGRDSRRSRSRSVDRYSRDRQRGRERDSRRKSRSPSPYRTRDRRRGRYEDERRSRSRYNESSSPVRRGRSPSPYKASPKIASPSPVRRGRSPSPYKASPNIASPEDRKRSISPNIRSPRERINASRSPSPRHSDAEE